MKKFFYSILPYAIFLSLVLLILGGVRLVRVIRYATEEKQTVTSSVKWINSIAPTEEGLFFTRTSVSSEERFSYTLYRLSEDSKEEKVEDAPGRYLIWSRADGRYFYLADSKTLASFDPVTGVAVTYALSQEYNSVAAAEDGFVCLMPGSGPLTVYVLADGRELNTGLEGFPDGIFAGQLLMWDHNKATLHRYDCEAGKPLPKLDLSSHWLASGGNSPDFHEVNGDLYLLPGAYLSSNLLLVIPDFDVETAEPQEIKVGEPGQYIYGMTEAEGQLVFMVKRRSMVGVEFLTLNSDGSTTQLAEWPEMQRYHGGEYVWMGCAGGKVYAVQRLNRDRGIFSFGLEALAGTPQSNSQAKSDRALLPARDTVEEVLVYIDRYSFSFGDITPAQTRRRKRPFLTPCTPQT